MQQTQLSPREHHFYVSIAKFLFYHLEYGIVSVRDPIKISEAEQYDLSPLMLYGLTVPRLPIRWMTFTPIEQPRAFRDVLMEAWRNAEGLRGQPDVLRINRYLSNASPDLIRDMEKIGVQVEVADAKEKSLPASLRSAQDASRWLMKRRGDKQLHPLSTVQTFCQDAQYDHDSHIRHCCSDGNNREVREKIQMWLTLPRREPVPLAADGLDWEPGRWLSSWETSLPPHQPRYFNFESFDGRAWLLTGKKEQEDIFEENDFLAAESDYDNAAEIAKNLIACWPNPPVEIAKCIGVTLRELQWFTSGKASLDLRARLKLEKLLSIEYSGRYGCYLENGPYVLMANKQEPVKAVYESISGGGDACPFEIVPDEGVADPSWRYVLINVFGEPPSILMAPRGAKILERLPDLLLNFDGIKTVAPEFYRDVVSTCARACREPTANIREIRDFGKRFSR